MSSLASAIFRPFDLKFLHAMHIFLGGTLGAASSGAEEHGCLGEALKIWQSVQVDNGFSWVVAMYSSSRDDRGESSSERDRSCERVSCFVESSCERDS